MHLATRELMHLLLQCGVPGLCEVWGFGRWWPPAYDGLLLAGPCIGCLGLHGDITYR